MTTPVVLQGAFSLLSSRGPKGRGDLIVGWVGQNDIATLHLQQAWTVATRCVDLGGLDIPIVVLSSS